MSEDFRKGFRFKVDIDGVEAGEFGVNVGGKATLAPDRKVVKMSDGEITSTIEDDGKFFKWVSEAAKDAPPPLTRLVWTVTLRPGAMPCLPVGGPYGVIVDEHGARRWLDGYIVDSKTVRTEAVDESGEVVESVELDFVDPLTEWQQRIMKKFDDALTSRLGPGKKILVGSPPPPGSNAEFIYRSVTEPVEHHGGPTAPWFDPDGWHEPESGEFEVPDTPQGKLDRALGDGEVEPMMCRSVITDEAERMAVEGPVERGPVDEPEKIETFDEFAKKFGRRGPDLHVVGNPFGSAGEAPERGDVDFTRASGDVVCEECGRKYYDHPKDPDVLGLEDHHGVRQPFLHVLCDGRRVKL